MRATLTAAGMALVAASLVLIACADLRLVPAAGLCLVFGVGCLVASSSYPKKAVRRRRRR